MLHFTKMNGAGNDFVLADNRNLSLSLDTARIAQICDRHRGVGADGLLLIEPAQNGADFRMRYYNADGGEAEMCGNGARCFARYAQRVAGADGGISFETPAGLIKASYQGDLVELNMSEPHSLVLSQMAEIDGKTLEIHSVNTGVPHAVILVDDLDAVDIVRVGSAIRYHSLFAPRGTNVNFVSVLSHSHLAVRTYERGVEGETLACGTGVVACGIIHHALTLDSSPVLVNVKGGETLQVGFVANGDTYSDVTLKGPADFVFDGEIAI